MTLGLVRRGRPYYVAVIDCVGIDQLKLYDKFYKACETFHYREIMALSRAFSISPSTVENWKYKVTFPRWEIALQVIDWAKRGKPMNLVKHGSKGSWL